MTKKKIFALNNEEYAKVLAERFGGVAIGKGNEIEVGRDDSHTSDSKSFFTFDALLGAILEDKKADLYIDANLLFKESTYTDKKGWEFAIQLSLNKFLLDYNGLIYVIGFEEPKIGDSHLFNNGLYTIQNTGKTDFELQYFRYPLTDSGKNKIGSYKEEELVTYYIKPSNLYDGITKVFKDSARVFAEDDSDFCLFSSTFNSEEFSLWNINGNSISDLKYWSSHFENYLDSKTKGAYIFLDPLKTSEGSGGNDRNQSANYSKFFFDFLSERDRSLEFELTDLNNSAVAQNKLENYIEGEDKADLSSALTTEKINDIFKETVKSLYGNESKKIIDDIYSGSCLAFLSEIYNYDQKGFKPRPQLKEKLLDNRGAGQGHTSSHAQLREKDKFLKTAAGDAEELSHLGAVEFILKFQRNCKLMAEAFIHHEKDKSPNILFIDDSEDLIREYSQILKYWFPDINSYLLSDWKNFLSKEVEGNNKLKWAIKTLTGGDKGNGKYSIKEFLEKKCINYIAVDLDFKGSDRGFEILRYFTGLKKNHIKNNSQNSSEFLTVSPHLVAFSRYEDAESVTKSLRSGAIHYINKSEIIDFVKKIFQTETADPEQYHEFRNWSELYNLPPHIIEKLKAEVITGGEYKEGEGWNDLLKSDDYTWLNKLPKADLHCHIGTAIGSELLPVTAFIVLATKIKEGKLNHEALKDLIALTFPVAFDPQLMEEYSLEQSTNFSDKNKIAEIRNKSLKVTCDLKMDLAYHFGNGIDEQSDFILSLLQLTDKYICNGAWKKYHAYTSPEVFFFDPYKKIDLPYSCEKLNMLKQNLREKSKNEHLEIIYDDVILMFILMIYVRTTGDDSFQNIFNNYTIGTNDVTADKIFRNLPPGYEKLQTDFSKEAMVMNEALSELKKENISNGSEKKKYDNLIKDKKHKAATILGFLQSAHSKNRCLEDGSLFQYLRGCEYGGSGHLQTKLSVLLVTWYITTQYAQKDNIKYIGLRCSPNTYNKMGLEKANEDLKKEGITEQGKLYKSDLPCAPQMEALIAGLEHYKRLSFKDDFKTQINIIITAKRHKSDDHFDDNVVLAKDYRAGLVKKKKDDEKAKEKTTYSSYFDKPIEVVSFDLAGLEEGNRASKYVEMFKPLLKECFPVTIHAGEEDSSDGIWEAIYYTQSQNIGHGLSLVEDENLYNIVRDRHITIELCPISNILTRGSDDQYLFKAERIKSGESNENIYPLRKYFQDDINVTINTDNPVVNTFVSSDDNSELIPSNLSMEYLVAAKLNGGMSRWQTLRLIKNGFKGAPISKDDKRKLLNEIEDEVFKLIVDEYSD